MNKNLKIAKKLLKKRILKFILAHQLKSLQPWLKAALGNFPLFGRFKNFPESNSFISWTRTRHYIFSARWSCQIENTSAMSNHGAHQFHLRIFPYSNMILRVAVHRDYVITVLRPEKATNLWNLFD